VPREVRGGSPADVRVASFASTVAGIRAELDTPRGRLAIASEVLVGHYNVDNLALAVGVGEALGLPHEAIARGVAAMPGVPGRVERVANRAGLDILVDYAHTPDALTNVLGALRPLTRGRLICVFGCGGDRDPGKRPLMGAAVAAGADLAIVTSDNPRTEEPRAIIGQILPAVPRPFFVDVDRRVAIRAAIAEAVPGDVVLIAGKGHEDYQILGTTKVHFDDREEAAAAVAERVSLSAAEVEGALAEGLGGGPPPAPGRAGPAHVELRGDRAARFDRVVIDGRRAAPGDLYVAIRGASHDGHAFCAQAVAAGARGVVVDRQGAATAPTAATVFEVDDGREALGAIARLVRRRWGGRVVGVTGSAGKTTTKEMIAAALAPSGRTHRTQGSLNNETGVPLTLLGLRPFHDRAIIEMGMRGLGQIDYLARIAEPDVAIVTNAGVAHIGVVGSSDKIAEGKGEIYRRLPPHGCAIYPVDDPRLAGYAAGAPRTLSFGEAAAADVRLVRYAPRGAAGSELTIRIAGLGREVAVALPLVGRHNALNATCALAAVVALGVDPTTAALGLADSRPAAMRGELADCAGRTLLIDCYNANPASMDAALATVAEAGGLAGARTVVAAVGDMLELGDEAAARHREVGRRAAELGVAIVALGDQAAEVVAAARAGGVAAEAASDPVDAAARVRAMTVAGDWILIKGSRGMRMERVVAALGGEG
jgi:murE/murF fusion protein